MTTRNETSPWPSDDNGEIVVAGSHSLDLNSTYADNDECKILCSSLLRVLQGVGVATKRSDDDTKLVRLWISSRNKRDFFQNHTSSDPNTSGEHKDEENNCNGSNEIDVAFSLRDWRAAIASDIPGEEEESRQLASITLGVAFLREKSRQAQDVSHVAVAPADLEIAWSLIRGALTSLSLLTRPLCSASRSAQGFLAVALCSLVKDGLLDELFRLHVWLPDGKRGSPDFGIHSHQSFVQSWILAGEGTDHAYNVEPVTDPLLATHAEYALAWNDGKTLSAAFKTHQTYSIVVNTGKLVRATPTVSAAHTRGMSYTIPQANFHKTKVLPDILHATLVFFDAHRGFEKDTGVLGPKDGESFKQLRDPAGVTPAALASMADAVQSWEILMEQGQQHVQRAEFDHASTSFNNALNSCESIEKSLDATRYKHLALSELKNLNSKLRKH